MKIKPCNNFNQKRQQSFGMVSLQKWENWFIGISKYEPDVVSVEGFKDFSSKNAEFITNLYEQLGNNMFKAETFNQAKKYLIAIVDEAREKLPLFSEKDAKFVKELIENPEAEINSVPGMTFIGDI